MYLTLIFLPLIGSTIAGLFGRQVGSNGACIITVSCLFLTCLLSLTAFYEVALAGSPVYIKLISWIDSELFNVDWGFLFDTLTVIMCCVVTFVSSLVHLYSTEYMAHDPHLPRFMSYLSLFTFFMLILVTADNYIQMFVGWEGVGLCSYLLINFWFTRIQANKAAIKAMIVNRVGDFGLALGILTIFIKYQSVDYATVFSITPKFVDQTFNFLNFEVNLLTVIGLLLFVGSVGKSAQIGLHTWLPDAHVQAPTVGSVFLAAVLLKLGTYGLMRIAIPFFPEAAFYFKDFFIIMGVIGIIYGAFCALGQTDFKKLVAYSSVSHMGFIMVGLFAFNKVAFAGSLYQMINHGISAGGLFLIVGFLYERLHTRNLNEFGGLSKTVPVMAIAFMIMTLSSVALPGTNGFVGEFPILLGAFQVQPFYVLFAGTGVILGAVYALKAYQLVMLGPQTRTDLGHLHDLNAKEIVAMVILAIFIFGIGFFPKTFFGKSDATLEQYSDSIIGRVVPNGH